MSKTRIEGTTPTIVGAAQVIQRPDPSIGFADLRGPYELMLDAARGAADDAGAAQLLRKLDWIGVVGGFWSFTNPAQVLGEKLGSPDAVLSASRDALEAVPGLPTPVARAIHTALHRGGTRS